jgi:hypothetical protein
VALFQQPGGAIAQGAFNGNFQIGGSHKVMNAFEFLDTPGEFFFDKTSRTLYYFKAAADDMTTATVFAPNNVTTLLRIGGTSTSSHARNITFAGLTVQHSDWNLVNVAGSAFKQAQQGNSVASVTRRRNFHAYFYRMSMSLRHYRHPQRRRDTPAAQPDPAHRCRRNQHGQ